jgi:DNA-binding protein H-NS
MQPKKSALSSLSNEALCKLRDEIAALLNSRAEDLRREIERLTGGAAAHAAKANGGDNDSKVKRKKAAPKYRSPDGRIWSGRGKRPRWLTSALKDGKNLEDFLIIASEKESSRLHQSNGSSEPNPTFAPQKAMSALRPIATAKTDIEYDIKSS